MSTISTIPCLGWFGKPTQHSLKQENVIMAYRISGKTLVLIGKKMRKIRKGQKREQVEVAEEAGVDTSYYARVERGEANPTLEVLYAIIKALHIKSSDLFPF